MFRVGGTLEALFVAVRLRVASSLAVLKPTYGARNREPHHWSLGQSACSWPAVPPEDLAVGLRGTLRSAPVLLVVGKVNVKVTWAGKGAPIKLSANIAQEQIFKVP